MDTAMEEDRRLEFEEAFVLFDRDGDGLVDGNDLRRIMRSLGQNVGDPELREMLSSAGVDKNGKISSLDFINIMERKSKDIENEEEIREGFRFLDRKGVGTVSVDDLMHLMSVFNNNQQPDQQIYEMMREAGIENNGQINYEEFIKTMTSK
ncbi:unnamed protein product [Didymodactylos carnosus]|uniref:EF-hand domain-containing protein n=1 Tax=Didymodactylos carnosus TaxID=1234261 RepID=A0A8S2FU85_9BILA|nr:unnamed protein product [Didymodactylos carnosus]CAF4343163.1 unnamed protein product [Didymodactylos carnosus]